jgi:hypothetical protein
MLATTVLSNGLSLTVIHFTVKSVQRQHVGDNFYRLHLQQIDDTSIKDLCDPKLSFPTIKSLTVCYNNML